MKFITITNKKYSCNIFYVFAIELKNSLKSIPWISRIR
jgi:hypothetical protein